jgi:hypothetical protein
MFPPVSYGPETFWVHDLVVDISLLLLQNEIYEAYNVSLQFCLYRTA